MKKRLFMFATAALMLAACSNDGEVAVNDGAAQLQSGSGAVAFDTPYTSSATKAGETGIMNTTTLQTQGFGVFATVSDGDYASTIGPNFMYNQYVYYEASAWAYTPLKYWPNETQRDPQTASPAPVISSGIDKLSFFAYAPYVASADLAADAAKGRLKGVSYDADPEITDAHTDAVGIQAVIANNANDDAWVRYAIASKPSQSVDLLWGVAPSGNLRYTAVNGDEINVPSGMPLKELIKPAKDQKIKFLFKHALARLGLTVVAAIDQVAAGGELNAATKIAVEEVVITDVSNVLQLKTKGTLNLNNSQAGTARWINTDDATPVSFTVSNAVDGGLNPNIAYDTNAATTWGKSAPWTGVTPAESPVIAEGKYFMVIPSHGDTELQVQITYYVITQDPKLAGGYSSVKNVITKRVTVSNLTNNKAYNLKLILGLTSVKLDAEVADWQVDGSTEVYLPQNAE